MIARRRASPPSTTAVVTGTPAGVGYPRKPPIFMKPGDHVEVEVEGLGILVNTIADEA